MYTLSVSTNFSKTTLLLHENVCSCAVRDTLPAASAPRPTGTAHPLDGESWQSVQGCGSRLPQLWPTAVSTSLVPPDPRDFSARLPAMRPRGFRRRYPRRSDRPARPRCRADDQRACRQDTRRRPPRLAGPFHGPHPRRHSARCRPLLRRGAGARGSPCRGARATARGAGSAGG